MRGGLFLRWFIVTMTPLFVRIDDASCVLLNDADRARLRLSISRTVRTRRARTEWHRCCDRSCPESLVDRRNCLLTAASAPFTGFWGTSRSAAADDFSLCGNGVLSPEQAIPGSYQQVCMLQPVRKIPVNTGQGTVWLSIEQRDGGAGMTGMAIWNSSLLLCRLLERLALSGEGFLRGKDVMELGCGPAQTSMAAACLGAASVLATDGNQAVVELAADNIRLNNLQDKVSAMRLPWGLLESMDYSDTTDVVLGSDLTYFSGNWPAVAESMATVIKPTGMVLYLVLGHAGFPVNAEIDGFLSVASSKGLVPLTGDWSEKKLTDQLVAECVTTAERKIVAAAGGVRAVALGRKYHRS